MEYELPTLDALIPRVRGSVYSYMGMMFLVPDNISDASKAPDHGVIRSGFLLYEILEWNTTHKGWKVRRFSAALTEDDLRRLTLDPAVDDMAED